MTTWEILEENRSYGRTTGGIDPNGLEQGLPCGLLKVFDLVINIGFNVSRMLATFSVLNLWSTCRSTIVDFFRILDKAIVLGAEHQGWDVILQRRHESYAILTLLKRSRSSAVHFPSCPRLQVTQIPASPGSMLCRAWLPVATLLFLWVCHCLED